MKYLILFLLVACSGEETLDKQQLYQLVKSKEPSAEIVIPKDINSGVQCSDYNTGCISGYRVKVIGIEMVFVQFETIVQAKSEAKRLNEYWLKNWLIEEVKGEPIIERFIENQLKAKFHENKALSSSKKSVGN